jgi:hypothetical protein
MICDQGEGLPMETKTDEGIVPKYCPLIKAECLQDGCVFWIRSSEMVRKNCAVVVIAQQLNAVASKSPEVRLS